MACALVAAAALPGLATAEGHLPPVTGLIVDAGNQRLEIRWDPATDARATGYFVYVHADGRLLQTLDADEPRATYAGAVNGRPYAVQVAARDADGAAGPRSDPVAAVPGFGQDQTYLALGLIVVWLGLWFYALLLTRVERNLHNRLDRLQKERQRLGEPR